MKKSQSASGGKETARKSAQGRSASGGKKVLPVKKAKTAVKAAPVKITEPAKSGDKTARPAPKTKGEDTGSVDFQIENFTAKIATLAKHLKAHPHDYDSRRGLLIMVGKRRRLLNYVKKAEPEKYEQIAKSLKLKVEKV
jgi:small subunit ribosomal protein S15